jgi:hypothetical protein
VQVHDHTGAAGRPLPHLLWLRLQHRAWPRDVRLHWFENQKKIVEKFIKNINLKILKNV